MNKPAIQNIAIQLFLDALFLRHGYDFHNYNKASLKRRILILADNRKCKIEDLIPFILNEEGFLDEVLEHLSVPATEMFRDPGFFQGLSKSVFPLLETYPHFNIWQAGCASGEEVYSLAILLDEIGLLNKVQIYATDINDKALAQAEDGIFPVRFLPEYELNYRKAGGRKAFSDYYLVQGKFFRIHDYLRKKIVFAHHNLVTDGVFCEVHLLLCRNVLIYFNALLKQRVLRIFHQSIVRGGVLCLGGREVLSGADNEKLFSAIDKENMIFHKT